MSTTVQGKFGNHVDWMELEDGVLTECAILRRLGNGDVYYFPIQSLDMIDKQRLRNIVMNRNAGLYELWDLMSQITLGNGVNALLYFNQLVKVRTAGGAIVPFGTGRVGVPVQTVVKSEKFEKADDTEPAKTSKK
jgi:hypothetical protein